MTRLDKGPLLVAALLLAALAAAPAQAQDATCADVYKIYQTCYDGGKQTDMETCQYLVQGMDSQLLGEEGVGGFAAALSVAMCRRGCQDGAQGKAAMSLAAFRKEFCGQTLK